MKIIIPIINNGIGDLVMILPLLKNIENNKNLRGVLILNHKNYKIILENSFIKINNFEIILERNISNPNFWFNIRKKSKIILSPTIGLKPLILWIFLGFKIYSTPYTIGNNFFQLGIKSPTISAKKHEVEININILDIYLKENKIRENTKIYYPELMINSKKEKIIFIHPGFDGNSKIPKDWGINNWINLIKKISEIKKNSLIKIIIGPGFEKKFKKNYLELEKKLNNVKILETDFQNLLKELSKGEFLINTDSGVGHLAGALGLKTITLFGPADEKQTGVFSKNAISIRAKNSKPCYSQGLWTGDCKNNGLNKIKVNDIVKHL